jgi:hypothetical protein
MSQEEQEKLDLLVKINKLERYGIFQQGPRVNIQSSLEEIIFTYEILNRKHEKEELKNTVANIVASMSVIMDKTNPEWHKRLQKEGDNLSKLDCVNLVVEDTMSILDKVNSKL